MIVGLSVSDVFTTSSAIVDVYSPFRWTSALGMVNLGPLPGDSYGVATAVSADGSVVVGESRPWDSLHGRAFRWTEAEGIVPLGEHPPGVVASRATDISADGTTVVGEMWFDDGRSQPFRFTQHSGFAALGTLPGNVPRHAALSVSADGSVIVGQSGGRPLIWDAGHGLRDLETVLLSFGLADAMEGWSELSVAAISDDGRTLAGYGRSPRVPPGLDSDEFEGFVAYIPEPSAGTLAGLIAAAALAAMVLPRRAARCGSGARG